MDKINKIEGLPIEVLKKVFIEVINQIGFCEVTELQDGIIQCLKKNPLGKTSQCFLLTSSHLREMEDVNRIGELIREAQRKSNSNTISIVSSFHVSNGFKQKVCKSTKDVTIEIEYIDRDELIELIDLYHKDFWRHNDQILLQYENDYKEKVSNDNQLRKLRLPSEKYERLLNIYISPTLSTLVEDPKTNTIVRKNADINSLLLDNKPTLISGLSGSGKTTLLKNIGLEIINRNEKEQDLRTIPIYVFSIEFLENDFDIAKILRLKMDEQLQGIDLKDITKRYNIQILVDSIDEFDEYTQGKILKKLYNLYERYRIVYFIGTRESDKLNDLSNSIDLRSFEISRFNTEQIKRFVSNFLSDDRKTDNLLDALRENKILERLPITPLTLSLITILYEETDFEIPATITDVYKNFNTLIIGRGVVSSKIEFIDISFKERILSVYALHLMNDVEHHKPLSHTDFINFFIEFFKDKTLPIEGLLHDVLEYLIANTGILYIKEKQWIAFTHDSYMEFYAALEIFNYNRALESKLVENFCDLRWQNVAIFYAGMTKDMPDFANNILRKIKQASKWFELLACVQGGGYITQALYLTDNNIRKDIVLSVLDVVLECNELLKKMATDQSTIFKNYKLPIIHIINFLHFYEMFNSITLTEPLQLAFEELRDKYIHIAGEPNNCDKSQLPALGFKLLELAFTMDSKRINRPQPLEEVVLDKNILKDPNLYILADFSLSLMGKKRYKEVRNEIKKKFSLSTDIRSKLIDDSTSKIRFSLLDTIQPNRNVKILVEGKTDVTILEHAFMVLTNGSIPYWKASMATANGDTGSSTAVSKAIETAISFKDDYDVIIAMFDHDLAGLKEYRFLQHDFNEKKRDNIKEHKKGGVFLLTLPIPDSMTQYLQQRQEFNFFEIEHYFGHTFLKEHDMLESTPIENLFAIKEKKKAHFANSITQISDTNVFRKFVDLFKAIDEICNVDINYEV